MLGILFRKRHTVFSKPHVPMRVHASVQPTPPCTPEADAKAELRRQMYERMASRHAISAAEEMAHRKFCGK